MTELVEKLKNNKVLEKEEFVHLLQNRNKMIADILKNEAVALRKEHYGNKIYVRGLIEFTNYCKNDCYYCGIRRSNANAERYRLTKEEILACCADGYETGYRTFVLQGGEDGFFTEEKISDIVYSIKEKHPDCAVTLSVGEHPKKTYKAWFDAGADRYLLRHETADACHYARLHPEKLTLENRKACLYDLKEIGFQVGCGFMVGSPFQTFETLAKDLLFINELSPQMVGLGPFIPHHDTPFKDERGGELELCLFLLSVVRIMLPKVLLPATTALGTIHPQGRELGILSGANVCMPNLSPESVRKKYMLYDNKLSSGKESAQYLAQLSDDMEKIGYRVVVDRGDHADKTKQ